VVLTRWVIIKESPTEASDNSQEVNQASEVSSLYRQSESYELVATLTIWLTDFSSRPISSSPSNNRVNHDDEDEDGSKGGWDASIEEVEM
jgi:hypothetical protein